MTTSPHLNISTFHKFTSHPQTQNAQTTITRFMFVCIYVVTKKKNKKKVGCHIVYLGLAFWVTA